MQSCEKRSEGLLGENLFTLPAPLQGWLRAAAAERGLWSGCSRLREALSHLEMKPLPFPGETGNAEKRISLSRCLSVFRLTLSVFRPLRDFGEFKKKFSLELSNFLLIPGIPACVHYHGCRRISVGGHR